MTQYAPDPHAIELTSTPDTAARDLIHQGIKHFNNLTNDAIRIARDPAHGPQPLDVYLRDSTGTIIGGLTAETLWDWLLIKDLWLPADLRGKNYGSHLLETALHEATRRGCQRATLKTYSFQARGFYERFGFRVVGVLEDYPPGHSFYWMRKDLAPVTP